MIKLFVKKNSLCDTCRHEPGSRQYSDISLV